MFRFRSVGRFTLNGDILSYEQVNLKLACRTRIIDLLFTATVR